MRCCFRVARFPTLHTGQSILFAPGAPDLDEREFGFALALGRLNARRLRVSTLALFEVPPITHFEVCSGSHSRTL
jgi:hypothetical protein